MQSRRQSPTSTFRTILLIAIITLVVAVLPARAQNAVPPATRQAGPVQAFAPRLTDQGRPDARRRPPALARTQSRRGLPLDTIVLYENGPVDGQDLGWQINYGFTVSDSMQAIGPATGMQFWAWLIPGDSLTSAKVQIGAAPFGNELFDQTLNFTASNCFSNQYGYNVCLESASFTGPTLNGNAWLTLSNASVPSGDAAYWDVNNGVGCASPGCPSQAQENTIGTIPSEAFTLLGAGTTTTSTTIVCEGYEWKTLHDFTGAEDGGDPAGGVVADQHGNLYGTTWSGGNGNAGTAFKLVQEGSNWLLNTLYSFAGGAAGNPASVPLIGPNGTLYSTTGGGIPNCNNGPYGQYCGEVIDLRPSPATCLSTACPWTENVLYQFLGGADTPGGISAVDPAGNLYGSQSDGGAQGQGAVFELTPSHGAWTKTVLYSFTGGNDGMSPGSVLLGNDGNLYGYAQGGATGNGLAFQLLRLRYGWTLNVIYTFQPFYEFAYGNLVQDSSGNLYGARGVYRTDQYGWYIDGQVYQLANTGGSWTFSEIYRVRPTTYNSYVFIYNLASDAAGNVYSAAAAYCVDCGPPPLLFDVIWIGGGPIFELPAGLAYGMTTDTHGNLYGAFLGCGTNGQGSIWKYPR